MANLDNLLIFFKREWGFRGKAPRRGGRKRLALNDKMIGDARLRGHDKKNRGHNTIGRGFDEGESSP